MTKNSGDWEGLQGHDDHPAQFKHKAWVHEGGVAYIYIDIWCIYMYMYMYMYTLTQIRDPTIFSGIFLNFGIMESLGGLSRACPAFLAP